MPGMFGGGGSDAPMEAASVQAQYAMQAAQIQKQMFDQVMKNIEPWLKGGTWGNEQLQNLLSGKSDPTQLLKQTPGYSFTQREGIKGLDLAAASKGLSKSGPQMKGITDWSENLALNKAYLPFIAQLQNLSGAGLNAGGMGGNWSTQTGGQIGQDYLMAGQALGQGIYNQSLMEQASQPNWGSLLGAGVGILAAPFTGGTSLAGAAMNGLGSIFGGRGGGGGIPSSYVWDVGA